MRFAYQIPKSMTTHGAITDRETTSCCAKCRRGTKALIGPCGYDGACMCHVRASKALEDVDGLLPLTAMKVAVRGDSGANSYMSGRTTEEQ